MANEGFYELLRQNYEDEMVSAAEGQIGTVAGILVVTAWWLQGRPELPRLLEAIPRIRARVQAAVDGTRADLAAGRLHRDLRLLMESHNEAYADLGQALGQLETLLRRESSSGVVAVCEEIKRRADRVDEVQIELQNWLQADVPRCPRCGSSGEALHSRCEPCGLDRLVPNPEPPAHQRTAVLGSAHFQVFEAYQAVLSGAGGLPRLLESLGALHRLLKDMNTGHEGARENLQAALASSLAGVQQMQSVATTHSVRDLDLGWERIFAAALELRQALPEIAADGEEIVEDRVDLSGED
ncbi:MAG: hypothetical protein HY319_04430 [Armatimonadetes bacterium]|nr:hypothetical protein [Armatimonadota bacterium]